jgi:HD-GYP domain-containing protein (c-di-GMP phosphodiesterase class II)
MRSDADTNRVEAAAETAVFTEIAGHARAAGFCLLIFSPLGDLIFHDETADPFFLRYVVPACRLCDGGAGRLRQAVARLTNHPHTQTWDFIPGAVVAAVPHFDRRGLRLVLALAAPASGPAPDKDLAELCALLQTDAGLVRRRTGRLAASSRQAVALAADLLTPLLCDKLRLNRLEGELNALSTQLANAYEQLSLIEMISGGMRLNRRPQEFFRDACAELVQTLGVRGMGVAVNAENARQEPVLYGELELPRPDVLRLGEQLLEMLAGQPAPLILNSLDADARFQWLGPVARQLIAVPLQRGNGVVGCFFALDKVRGDFDSVDSKLLASIANESAVFVENAMLFGNLHALMMGLLHSLTSAIDAKDAYTSGHSERVALLSRYLATQVGLPDPEVERIYMAGLLHDVGKIGVGESVLQKTGRLTPEEYELMKRHPEIGAHILDDIPQMADIIPGVLSHHERYDGRGYPFALAGKDIPIMGRIICLADCFDAMTSNRTYRQAVPIEAALAEIRRCSGTQFDPALAELFLRLEPDQIRLLLQDHRREARRLLEFQGLLRAA